MSGTASPSTLFSISLNPDYSLGVTLSPWVAGGALVLLMVWVFIWRRFIWNRLGTIEIDRADIGIGSGTLSFKPNVRDQEIAYKIWVELSTRKIGLPIDLRHDVISEIYDSWHTFFSITRELIKDIPVNKVKNDSTRQIITLSVGVLNEGLRPHLTSWQARFRHWYERQLVKVGDDVDPQAIQAKYPRYSELRDDLLIVNDRLIKYREKMRELVLGVAPTDERSTQGLAPKTPSL